MNHYKYYQRIIKQRSIKEIYDLYIRAKERSEARLHVIGDIIDEIVEKIPLTGNHSKKHITYFQHDDVFYQYEMSYNKEWESYGTSFNIVKFEGTVEEIRKQTIDFIITNDLAFELGEKYRKYEYYNKRLHLRVMHYLDEAIKKDLEVVYKDFRVLDIPDIIPVNVGNTKLIYGKDGVSSRYYKRFNLIGEMEIDPIEM